jgi:uncharacterized protein DUF2255
VRSLLLWAWIALLAAGAATYWAGEQNEVAVLHTADADGRGYESKVWVVDHQGDPWVRVANPERSWYRHLLENPNVELVRNGQTRRYRAEPQDVPEIAADLDAVFREKYGLVDWWYGLLLRRDAIPIRLAPQ